MRDEVGLRAAVVVWQRWVGDADMAPLEVTEPGWVVPVRRHPVRRSRLVTNLAAQASQLIGFPLGQRRRRDSHHTTEEINPGSRTARRFLVLGTAHPLGVHTAESRCAGSAVRALLSAWVVVAACLPFGDEPRERLNGGLALLRGHRHGFYPLDDDGPPDPRPATNGHTPLLSPGPGAPLAAHERPATGRADPHTTDTSAAPTASADLPATAR
ncbi:MAG TPA: hypothetical protein VE196_09225 [Pseudonocardiaceae bacterium]|nr:hypothetical protein [Pseudonocardiaceae bacterium]